MSMGSVIILSLFMYQVWILVKFKSQVKAKSSVSLISHVRSIYVSVMILGQLLILDQVLSFRFGSM